MNYYSAYPKKAICLDIETTGVDPSTAEILQLSIIDYNGNILFNEYIKPDKAKIWPGAEAVHHISPFDVMNKPRLNYYRDQLKKIFNDAELIIAYNGDHYDIPIIARYGFPEITSKQSFDVMLEFAPIYGAWDDYHGSYTWQKLHVCADYYGYRGSSNFHDSLEDVRATLYCYKKIVEKQDDEELPQHDDYLEFNYEEFDDYEYTDEDAVRDTQAFWEGALIELEEQEEEVFWDEEYYYEEEPPQTYEIPQYDYTSEYYGKNLADAMHQLDEERDPYSGHY